MRILTICGTATASSIPLGPGFHWPIFNYGRIENNVRIQDARFQQLLVNYQDTVLRAAQEVEDAMTGFLKAQETACLSKTP